MRSDLPAYLLVQWRTASSVRLVSESTSDGARAVCVFDELVAAKAFLILENLGSGWEVIEYTPRAAAELLETCAGEGVRYVALNPPSTLTRGAEESLLIPIREFIDHLLGD